MKDLVLPRSKVTKFTKLTKERFEKLKKVAGPAPGYYDTEKALNKTMKASYRIKFR
jgi:hypothetical protein